MMDAPTAAMAPILVRLADYAPPEFLVDSVELIVRLDARRTVVQSRLWVRRNPAVPGTAPLLLDAEAVAIGAVSADDAPAQWRATPEGIAIDGLGAAAVIDIATTLDPQANTELSGLYLSQGSYFTQCEAQGFRRITPFPDRPDVMARYTVTIVADAATCPTLLSNGNRVDGGVMDDGRHWAKWHDPHPKPCYLFALVAGDLACVADRFTTASGRDVALGIHVRRGDEASCGHAMASLKRAMAWDELVYGLEYDLDVFNIAAVADFNMGAMENKGLNVFNTKYVLAHPDTATDADHEGIETVIAHEYFHNWTGNRITCRDWFQLSLKEGLTVFRDQQFSADMGSAAVRRIADVRRLRAGQFPEDAGPLAHPVRPGAYVKIDNFYTATVYQKGAEVVRMIHTLLGVAGFRAGMDLYVARHDNQAVRIEEFVAAMQDATGVDLAGLRGWYDQAGTPVLTATDAWDEAAGRYTLTLAQHTDATAGQPGKQPLPIPVAMGLIAPDGIEAAGTRVLLLTEARQEYVFTGLAARPVPSLLRGFSAPVKLAPLPAAQLRLLAAHDTDRFVRWDSGQIYAAGVLLAAVAGGQGGLDGGLRDAHAAILAGAAADPAFAAEALALPGEAALAERMPVIDPDAIHAARTATRAALGQALRAEFAAVYTAMDDGGRHATDGAAIGRRALKNVALGYLCAAGEHDRVLAQYRACANMTDVLAALALLTTLDIPARADALADFHARWRGDDLVLDKWFALQAASPLPGTVAAVRALLAQADFSWTNPNRARAVIGSFAMANPVRFHAADGSGYELLADAVLRLDAINSQTAARLLPPLGQFQRHTPGRTALMRAQLARILAAPGLSAATRELAERSAG